MSRIKPLPIPAVDSPAGFETADAGALQAVYRGEGTPEQQKRAMEWIIKSAAHIGGQSYRAGDSHATSFGEGRRFVGAQILSLLEINLTQLRQQKATK